MLPRCCLRHFGHVLPLLDKMDYPLGCVGELLPSHGRGLISGTISDIGEFTQIRDGSQTSASEKFASHNLSRRSAGPGAVSNPSCCRSEVWIYPLSATL